MFLLKRRVIEKWQILIQWIVADPGFFIRLQEIRRGMYRRIGLAVRTYT
jgi:hypothetical protein